MCGAAHPSDAEVLCTVPGNATDHAMHVGRHPQRRSEGPVTWPNDEFVEPIGNPRRWIEERSDEERARNLAERTAGARSEEEASLPYNGTSGYNGYGDTSRARAEGMDASGETALLQTRIARYVIEAKEYGRTWREVQDRFPEHHHGAISGALSDLHKVGRLTRLAERRDGSEIYVGVDYVNGRPERRQGNRTMNELDDWLRPAPDGRCYADGNEVAFKEAMMQHRGFLRR